MTTLAQQLLDVLDEAALNAGEVDFEIGDPIEIEGKKGEVIDINDDDTMIVDLTNGADDSDASHSYTVYPHDDDESDCDIACLPESYNADEEFTEAQIVKRIRDGKLVKFKKRTKRVRLTAKQKRHIKVMANKRKGKKVKSSVLKKRKRSNKLRKTKKL